MSVKERQGCIERVGKMSIRRQCELLSVNRSSLYYTPAEESEADGAIKEELEAQYSQVPFYGGRRLKALLRQKGYAVNIKRVRRLMRDVGWCTLCPKRKTTHIDERIQKYPYLLRGMSIEQNNQVWELDITYIPMRKGFMYLFAVIDVFSRYVVGWDVSNTMTASWCCSVLSDAIERHGKPDIINSDQGSQFTSSEYIDLLKCKGIKISMDGRGRALDDIYIERLWRSVKQEYAYLNPCEDGRELWMGLNRYFHFYNGERFHQSLGYKVPENIYKRERKNKVIEMINSLNIVPATPFTH